MRYELTFGGISYIDPRFLPEVNAALVLSTVRNDWFVKTAMGLAATANYDPPRDEISDFPARAANSKAHRGLLGGRMVVSADGHAPPRLVMQTNPTHVVDGGWTPPVSRKKFPSMTIPRLMDGDFQPGEVSGVSGWRFTQPHPHGRLAAPPGHQMLAHGLVKFRAGPKTDEVGTSWMVGAPFHVPWVWNEMVVSYAAGKVRITFAGSIFPTHAWYLGGRKRYTITQVGDKEIPGELVVTPGGMDAPDSVQFYCKPEESVIYRVLNKGASAAGPQTSLADERRIPAGQPVTQHLNTVEAGQTATAEVDLARLPHV